MNEIIYFVHSLFINLEVFVMRKLDLILGYILLAICFAFYFMISKLPDKATLYPLFVTSILLFLTLIHLIVTYRNKSREESNAFKGLYLKQLFFVLGISGLYIAMINILGYVVSTVLYILISLIVLKTEKVKSIMLSAGTAAFIFILFKILLRVPLPKGFLI